jgi:hypothetical protein
MKADRASFPEVSKALEKVVLEKGLQLHATWLNKCIQVGPWGSSRSWRHRKRHVSL